MNDHLQALCAWSGGTGSQTVQIEGARCNGNTGTGFGVCSIWHRRAACRLADVAQVIRWPTAHAASGHRGGWIQAVGLALGLAVALGNSRLEHQKGEAAVVISQTLKSRARALSEKGNLNRAAMHLQVATRLDPNDIEAHHQLGEIFLKLDRKEMAIAEFQAVVGRYCHEGMSLKAMSLCKRILQIDPDHRETMVVLAGCYAKRDVDSTMLPASMCHAISGIPIAPSEHDLEFLREEEIELETLDIEEAELSPDVRANNAAFDMDLSLFSAGNVATADRVVTGFEEEEMLFDYSIDEDLILVSEPPPPPPTVSLDLQELPTTPLFSELDSEDFISVLEFLDLRHPLQWTRLFTEGDAGDSLFIIVQGRVRLFRENAEGEREVIAHLEAGAFFGEMAVVTGAPRLVSAETTEDTLLLELRRRALEVLTQKKPKIAAVALEYYRARLLANLLAKSPLFNPFSTDEKQTMSENFANAAVPTGTTILTQGQTGDGLYVVLRGSCDVLYKGDDGSDVKYSELHEGDVFGEIALITKEKAIATVRTSTQSHLLKLDAEIFQGLMMKNPVVMDVLQAMASKRMHDKVAAQISIGQNTVLYETS